MSICSKKAWKKSHQNVLKMSDEHSKMRNVYLKFLCTANLIKWMLEEHFFKKIVLYILSIIVIYLTQIFFFYSYRTLEVWLNHFLSPWLSYMLHEDRDPFIFLKILQTMHSHWYQPFTSNTVGFVLASPLHICNSFLWQQVTYISLCPTYLFIFSVPFYVTNLPTQ